MAADWTSKGEQALMDLLALEHAVVWNEAQAKISDRGTRSHRTPDPHILTKARKRLEDSGAIRATFAATRGGRRVEVLVPGTTQGRKRAIEDAAARKRLLEARYLSWASGSATSGPSLIGPAGEAVVHASLTQAAPHGYRLVKPAGGDVSFLLDGKVPGGPLDNAAFLTTLDAKTVSPTGTYLVTIEVKNIRSWVYPSKSELFQLLHKSGELQAAHPDIKIVPVFVCRRVHYLTFVMADHLGFYIIQTRRQYIRPHVADSDPAHLEEVRTELGYDLDPHDGAVPAMVDHFTKRLPGAAAKISERWRLTGPQLKEEFKALRDDHLSPSVRFQLTEDLAAAADQIHGEPDRRWHNPGED